MFKCLAVRSLLFFVLFLSNKFRYEYWRHDEAGERQSKTKERNNTVTYHLRIYKSNQPIDQREKGKMIKYNETHTHKRGEKQIYRIVVVAFRWKYCASIKHVCLLWSTKIPFGYNIFFGLHFSLAFDVSICIESIDRRWRLVFNRFPKCAHTTFINTHLNEHFLM